MRPPDDIEWHDRVEWAAFVAGSFLFAALFYAALWIL